MDKADDDLFPTRSGVLAIEDHQQAMSHILCEHAGAHADKAADRHLERKGGKHQRRFLVAVGKLEGDSVDNFVEPCAPRRILCVLQIAVDVERFTLFALCGGQGAANEHFERNPAYQLIVNQSPKPITIFA